MLTMNYRLDEQYSVGLSAKLTRLQTAPYMLKRYHPR